MRYLCLLFLSCLIGFQQCQATCKNPAAMTNFDAAQFSAQPWYVVAADVNTATCLKYTFSDNSAGTPASLGVTITIIDAGSTNVLEGLWKFDAAITNSDFEEQIPSGMNTTPLTVVDTDYSTFAIIYRCASAGVTTIDILEILSTDQTGYTAAMAAANAKLTSTTLNTISIVQHDNTCPTGVKAKFQALKAKLTG